MSCTFCFDHLFHPSRGLKMWDRGLSGPSRSPHEPEIRRAFASKSGFSRSRDLLRKQLKRRGLLITQQAVESFSPLRSTLLSFGISGQSRRKTVAVDVHCGPCWVTRIVCNGVTARTWVPAVSDTTEHHCHPTRVSFTAILVLALALLDSETA